MEQRSQQQASRDGEREVEAIARRVVELLEGRGSAGHGLIDAAEVARRLGVSRGTIYEKAGELGAVRLGSGPRARLRFDPELVAERLGPSTSRPKAPRQPARSPTHHRATAPGSLLPVRGPIVR